MRLIDADGLLDTMAIVAKKWAKTEEQQALMGKVIYFLERKPECIVRCKDCQHWKYKRMGIMGVEVADCCNEEYPFHCETSPVTKATDFCSYGDRRIE